MELSSPEALELVDHDVLDKEFDKWEDISIGVVGDVVRVLSKQKTWIAEMKEKLNQQRDSDAKVDTIYIVEHHFSYLLQNVWPRNIRAIHYIGRVF